MSLISNRSISLDSTFKYALWQYLMRRAETRSADNSLERPDKASCWSAVLYLKQAAEVYNRLDQRNKKANRWIKVFLFCAVKVMQPFLSIELWMLTSWAAVPGAGGGRHWLHRERAHHTAAKEGIRGRLHLQVGVQVFNSGDTRYSTAKRLASFHTDVDFRGVPWSRVTGGLYFLSL